MADAEIWEARAETSVYALDRKFARLRAVADLSLDIASKVVPALLVPFEFGKSIVPMIRAARHRLDADTGLLGPDAKVGPGQLALCNGPGQRQPQSAAQALDQLGPAKGGRLITGATVGRFRCPAIANLWHGALAFRLARRPQGAER